jgi:hypothetical protein
MHKLNFLRARRTGFNHRVGTPTTNRAPALRFAPPQRPKPSLALASYDRPDAASYVRTWSGLYIRQVGDPAYSFFSSFPWAYLYSSHSSYFWPLGMVAPARNLEAAPIGE